MKKLFTILFVVAVSQLQAQNVGIGTTTPNAPLQFGNGNANRKLVLYDVNNNDHQFFGFGLNSGELRYQINEANAGVAHKFFAGLDAATSVELMRIQGNGNVGIGTVFPDNKLSVNGSVDFSGNVGIGIDNPGFLLNFPNSPGNKISLAGTSGAHYGFGLQSNLLQIHSDASISDIAFGYGSSEVFTERMRIKGNGNIGIGTTTPNAPLQFGNGTANRKIVLFETNNNDHQFFGFGLNSGELRYQINEANSGVAHKFFAGANSSTSIELMRIQGDGMVRIAGQQSTGTGNKSLSIGGFGDIDVDAPFTEGGRFKILENGNVGVGVSNPVYRLDVGGSTNINGFTRLGESSPAIKTKLITGNASLVPAGFSDIPHGLNLSKIIGISVLVHSLFDFVAFGPGYFPNTGSLYHFQIHADYVRITNPISPLDCVNILGGFVKILLTYQE